MEHGPVETKLRALGKSLAFLSVCQLLWFHCTREEDFIFLFSCSFTDLQIKSTSTPPVLLEAVAGFWPSSPLPSWLHQTGSGRLNKEAHQRRYFCGDNPPSQIESPPLRGPPASDTPSQLFLRKPWGKSNLRGMKGTRGAGRLWRPFYVPVPRR